MALSPMHTPFGELKLCFQRQGIQQVRGVVSASSSQLSSSQTPNAQLPAP